MKAQLLQDAVTMINAIPQADPPTKYMLLASFVLYFKTPWKTEKWNTFPQRVEKGQVSLRDAIFSTDEEKNPLFWRDSKNSAKVKKDTERQLFAAIGPLGDSLRKKKYFPEVRSSSLVAIPDLSTPHAEPTFFPVDYLKKQVEQGNYVNELTGQPLSWVDVQDIRTSGGRDRSPSSVSSRSRHMASELIQRLVVRELEQLKQYHEACVVCRKRTRQFKTLRDYQTVYFCSLKCLGVWEG
jgi:hypothetical protein